MTRAALALIAICWPVFAYCQATATPGEWSKLLYDWREEWRSVGPYAHNLPPAERVQRQKRSLAGLEQLAQQAPSPFDRQVADRQLGDGYALAGTIARYRLREPQEAAALLAKAAAYGSLVGAIALADVQRFDLKNPRAAAVALRGVAPHARRPRPGIEPKNVEWLERWVARESRYLEDGVRFGGRLETADVEGAVFSLVGSPDIGNAMDPRLGIQALFLPQARAALDDIPAGNLAFLAAANALASLRDYEALSAALTRHDPAGFLSSVFLAQMSTFALRLDAEAAKQFESQFPDEVGRPNYIPPASGGEAPVIAIAKRFFEARGIAYSMPVDDPRMASPEGTWQLFIESLRAGDAPKALTCFSPAMREKMEPLLGKMSVKDMLAMADSFDGFSLGQRFDPFQEFAVTRKVDGGRRAALGTFVRAGKSWKIDSL